MEYGFGYRMNGDCTTDGCERYSTRWAAEAACVAQGQGCDAIFKDCDNAWRTSVHSTADASQRCEMAARKVLPSADQAHVMHRLESTESFAEVLACEAAWEESDHTCQTDADCVDGKICEHIFNECVADKYGEMCEDDMYGILNDLSQQIIENQHISDFQADPCLFWMTRHANMCNARMGQDSIYELVPSSTQGIQTVGIPGVGLNVRGRHICPARCGQCDWERDYGAKCTDNSDCPDDQFCAKECWTGNCQDGAESGVCQPCDYFIEPQDSLSHNDWGSCPPPPPPMVANKCLVYDASITEGCRITPHKEHELEHPTECEFNPPDSAAHADCIAAGNVGFHFEAYRLPSSSNFQRIRDTEWYERIVDDVWADGWPPAFVDTNFDEDLWFGSEYDFLTKAPGGFSDRGRYVMRWRGSMSVTTSGEYGFRTSSDDGSMLLISEERETTCQPEPGASQEPDLSICGGSLVDAGLIALSNLVNNQDCTWSVTCSDPSQTPRLTFSALNTEQDFDYVRVYDITGEQLAELHGTSLDAERIVSTGPGMEIQYSSDGGVNGEGFSASFVCCTAPFAVVVNNDEIAPGKRDQEGTYRLSAGFSYNIMIIHFAQTGANSMEVSWRLPNLDTWAPLGATSAGAFARISNPAGCVCTVVAGHGTCSYVEPHAGTEAWEVDASCKAPGVDLAACIPDFEMKWPEDTNDDGNLECGCTAAGHTTSTYDRNLRCIYTPGNNEQGPSCTGEVQICDDQQQCRVIPCTMGPVECEFECWPPEGICLASSQVDEMCGSEAYCDTRFECNDCEKACERPAVSTLLPGYNGTCLGLCGSNGDSDTGPCGTEESRNCCTDPTRVVSELALGDFSEFASETGVGQSDRACLCAEEICEATATLSQTKEQCLSQCRKCS